MLNYEMKFKLLKIYTFLQQKKKPKKKPGTNEGMTQVDRNI